MADAPGSPGTSFTCRSFSVMGSQSSPGPEARQEPISNNTNAIHPNLRTRFIGHHKNSSTDLRLYNNLPVSVNFISKRSRWCSQMVFLYVPSRAAARKPYTHQKFSGSYLSRVMTVHNLQIIRSPDHRIT